MNASWGRLELVEEGTPADHLERLIGGRAREVNPQDTGLLTTALGALDARRPAAMLPDPPADFLMIGCRPAMPCVPPAARGFPGLAALVPASGPGRAAGPPPGRSPHGCPGAR